MKNPGLILALPRSGTNWTVDVLNAGNARILQEPLWLHNGGSYEQNPLHPMRSSTEKDVSKKFGHNALSGDPYGQLLTNKNFNWLNEDNERSHIFKETNGFFHLEWLLKSLPNLKTVLLQRDIRGTISSFKKGNLFEKWHYRERLRELLRTIQSSNELDTFYGGVFNQDIVNSDPLTALSYYLGISMLEIKRQTQNQLNNILTVDYSDLILQPEKNFKDIAQHFEINNIDAVLDKVKKTIGETRAESPHSTRKRKSSDDFGKHLSKKESDKIESIWKLLELNVPKSSVQFSGNSSWSKHPEQQYEIHESQEREDLYKTYFNSKVLIPESHNKDWITETLVTNSEYADFINWLQKNGIPISVNGRNIFYNDRPQSKIHSVADICVINKGFENHPATHMNLIGAAAFSKWIGGRLPSSKEIEKTCFPKNGQAFNVEPNKELANFGHHHPGTTPVKYFPKNELGIYDPVGNVSTWVAEKFKPNTKDTSNLEYCRMGGAWSHDIKECDIENTIKGRPWWMAASTLGIRPVFEKDSLPDIKEVLKEITNFVYELQQESLSISEKNKLVHNFVIK